MWQINRIRRKLFVSGIVLLGLSLPASAQIVPGPQVAPLSSPPAPQTQLPPSAQANTPQTERPTPAKSIVSSPTVSLDYRVDRVGPSGLGKVDIWITPDQGDSWRRLAEEAPRRNPLQINLPGEGLFGVRLVAINGNGFGGNAPKRGDQPNFWVEVDSTAPLLQLGNIDAFTDGVALTICWQANDRNFGATPINLSYRSEADPTWQPLARGLKNTGQYRWQFPRDKGERFYIRVEATDQAGNVAHVDTPSPIVLDMVEPQLIVVGVTTSENRPQPRSFPAAVPTQPQQPVRPVSEPPPHFTPTSGVMIQN